MPDSAEWSPCDAAYSEAMGEFVMLVAAEDRALDPEFVKAGWWGLIIVVAIALGIVVLARSFSKHAKRADQLWEGEDPDDPAREGEQERRG